MSATNPFDLLAEATEEVLGTMFFVFTEAVVPAEVDLSGEKPSSRAIHTTLGFEGVWRGRVEFCLNPGMGRTLAANLLGQDEAAITDEMTLDAAREMTNMIVGRFLALLEPERGLSLGLPQARLVDESDITPLFHTDEAIILDSEDGMLFCRLFLEEEK
ncbi:MAG: chemotaxis protein CheX [Deltaproteobacteria bacterium]|nr:chemotaxis protein CheX [Deltaproteobacteria bacterium]